MKVYCDAGSMCPSGWSRPFYQFPAHVVFFLLSCVRSPVQKVGEEENAEDKEKHEQFDKDDEPQRPSPGHLPKTLPIELPDAFHPMCFHTPKFKVIRTMTNIRFLFEKQKCLRGNLQTTPPFL